MKTKSVHPHACGEHSAIKTARKATNGSSPRLWGALEGLARDLVIYRFIHTPVGSMSPPSASACMDSVHPHACGEHHSWASSSCCRNGSSPRLWGAFLVALPKGGARRFIPTPVGSMALGSWCPPSRTVHPHACGEHIPVAGADVRPAGSSPRLWGALVHRPRDGLAARFIPTPVGSMPPRRTAPAIAPVHPHACGEHLVVYGVVSMVAGSSPRLWGALIARRLAAAERRFIPTPVGSIIAANAH